MHFIDRLLSALPGRLRKHEQDLEEEIQAHLAIEAHQRMETGEAQQQAEYSARRVFGSVNLAKERTRDGWSFMWLEKCLKDVRFAARILSKTPGFTAVAALTLALGIGANTAIFSVVNAVLLQPLPFAHAERLVQIFSIQNGSLWQGPSPPDVQDFAERNRTFEKMTVYDVWRKNVSGILASPAPEQMKVALVSADFFEVLGIQPIMGRLFTPAENDYGRHYVAAIGYSLWKNRFAGRDDVLGQKIRINDEPYTIVAVMPDALPDWMTSPRVEVWTPFAFAPTPGISDESHRGARDNTAIGRLKPGVSLHFYLPPAHYSDPGSLSRFCRRFADRIRALPGVTDASVTTVYPPHDRWAQIFTIEGQTPPDLQELPTTRFGVTNDHYLKTMRIPLLRGRDFAESDTESREPVALINQQFVSRYFGSRDPVGVRIHLGQPEARTVPAPPNPILPGYVTVAGVIGNFRNNGLAFRPEPQLIALFRQEPSVNFGFKDIVVRTIANPRSIAPAIRRQLHEMDPNLPLAEVQTVEEYISKQTSDQRFVTSLLSIFAALGLALAVVGVYGVISFLVTQRTQELGIRLALGARPSHVLWLVLKQGVAMAAIGIVAGLIGASAARKLLAQLVFNVSSTDVATLAAVSVALLAIATVAGAVPGARAMRIDPANALRQE